MYIKFSRSQVVRDYMESWMSELFSWRLEQLAIYDLLHSSCLHSIYTYIHNYKYNTYVHTFIYIYYPVFILHNVIFSIFYSYSRCIYAMYQIFPLAHIQCFFFSLPVLTGYYHHYHHHHFWILLFSQPANRWKWKCIF